MICRVWRSEEFFLFMPTNYIARSAKLWSPLAAGIKNIFPLFPPYPALEDFFILS